ncbi:aminotransferase class I/II-fold pyridoxal phosphate-dependent enzyme [Methylobacterium sp. J-030]|uniref:DegT/DnrJ/EryC1/StrS family aminotransferase n=1 Tax=Methylobacterium sp. J-030 TaxID=2836627 RepID=UPI001FB93172|nr:DegT/DnrJ/EryC1/StrS family aminotransferase [Methylobacterium sp. J-030]MCJ2073103.1 aminotransferase class I/II-fold pyridoxal phosphate-dependent enzyme [Methylobacterium sp. J-030]
MTTTLTQANNTPESNEQSRPGECTDKESFDIIKIVDAQMIVSTQGNLGVLEASKQIGFAVKRIYFLTDLPKDAQRGGHAHKSLVQCFVCLKGEVTLEISKSSKKDSIKLKDYRKAVIVPPGCWRDLKDFTDDCVLLVLASEEYDEHDYIRNYDQFILWQANNEGNKPIEFISLDGSRETNYKTKEAISRVIESGLYVGGPILADFEAQFASYCESPFAVGVANGFDALSLTLRAWGIGKGDEVIVPAHSFIASAFAVESVGATPVLVDVDPETALLDTKLVHKAITPNTKAVMPVHLYGHPVDMDAIQEIAEEFGVFILEDAAQAHGASYKNKKCGSLGHAAAFSFYPTKNLGCVGDGGAVVLRDESVANRIRSLGNYGAFRKYDHRLIGQNSRLDTVQAAVLSMKLRKLDEENKKRSQLAQMYQEGLCRLSQIVLPTPKPYAEPVWHVYGIRIVEGDRDDLRDFLAAKGIGTNQHYPVPIHLQPAYAGRWVRGAFPVAEEICAQTLSLPLSINHSHHEIQRVISCIVGYFE